jgi:hypothetical protein
MTLVTPHGEQDYYGGATCSHPGQDGHAANLVAAVFPRAKHSRPSGSLAQEVFIRTPFVPTLKGQYIIKKLVLISSGIVVAATVLNGDTVADLDVAGAGRRMAKDNES